MNLDFRVFQPNLIKLRESNVCYLNSDKSVKQLWWQTEQILWKTNDHTVLNEEAFLFCCSKSLCLLKLLHVLWLIYFHTFTVLLYFCSLAQIFLRQFFFSICLFFYPGRFFNYIISYVWDKMLSTGQLSITKVTNSK